MKRIVFALALVMPLLLLASVVMAPTFEEEQATASVTVNQYVSITLTDAGTAGVNFGNLDPGTNDIGDADQGAGTPAIDVTNDLVSNVDINVNVKGTDFSGAGTIAASQVTYDDDEIPSQSTETNKAETALATTYPGTDYYTGVTPGSSVGFWFFIDVPSGQTAGAYTSTFTFRGDV